MGSTPMHRNGRATSSAYRKSVAINPSYGAGLELRALLPGLTAKVTGTRPCEVCGGPTASARKKRCPACPVATKTRARLPVAQPSAHAHPGMTTEPAAIPQEAP